LEEKDWVCVKRNTETYHAINSKHEVDLQFLSGYLHFHKTGIELGMPSQKGWVPAHDVALSVNRSGSLPAIAVSRDSALKFLKKEEFEIPSNQKGWVVVQHEGLALGWIKSLGNRFNNYLPKNWRIRMEIPGE
jgi:NOL1/NOP2/fmu family ribosome biogenesis protein